VAPLGTGTTMELALQLVGLAAIPLKVTVLVPCVSAKFTPVIVTLVPGAPEVGLRLDILGATVPVPVKGILTGTMFALFVIAIPPVLEPESLGEKLGAITQAAPGVNGEEDVQLSVSEKSPPESGLERRWELTTARTKLGTQTRHERT
jgi:hypothetical protein